MSTGPEVLQMLKEKIPYAEEAELKRPTKLWFKLPKDKLLEASRIMHDELDYKGISSISGVDRRTNLEVTYIVFSVNHDPALVFTVQLEKGDTSIPSIYGIWRGANWYEREVYDMFGITFENHPDLRRILLRDDADFHPLLKSYKLNAKPENWDRECRREG